MDKKSSIHITVLAQVLSLLLLNHAARVRILTSAGNGNVTRPPVLYLPILMLLVSCTDGNGWLEEERETNSTYGPRIYNPQELNKIQ